jgi:hypothetical protein
MSPNVQVMTMNITPVLITMHCDSLVGVSQITLAEVQRIIIEITFPKLQLSCRYLSCFNYAISRSENSENISYLTI